MLSKNIKIEIYRTIILPVVLHGCDTWSFTLREEHGVEDVREHGVEDGVWASEGRSNRGVQKTINNELHGWNLSPNIMRMMKSRKIRWAGHVARMGERCIWEFWWGLEK